MKKEKAWELLTNNYVAVLALTTINDVDRLREIVLVAKEFIPSLVNDITEKPKVDLYTMEFNNGRKIDQGDFDIAYIDKNNKHIIYLKGAKFAGAFYIF